MNINSENGVTTAFDRLLVLYPYYFSRFFKQILSTTFFRKHLPFKSKYNSYYFRTISDSFSSVREKAKARRWRIYGLFCGRGSKNRTHDTRFWRPLLYLLSYTPMCYVKSTVIYYHTSFRKSIVFWINNNGKEDEKRKEHSKKRQYPCENCRFFLVGHQGLEPRTDRLWAGCSNQLS